MRMRSCALLSLVFAACLELSAGAADLTPDHAYRLWSLRADLVDGNRIPVTLDRIAALLNSADHSLDLEQVRKLFHEREAARGMDARVTANEKLTGAIRETADTITKIMPAAVAADVPDDDGGRLFVFWKQPVDAQVVRIERRRVGDAPDRRPEVRTRSVRAGAEVLSDDRYIRPGAEYTYRIYYGDTEGELTLLADLPPVQARGNWFNANRTSLFFVVFMMSGAVLFYISRARSGAPLRIRKIAGLEAVDEAVGRATEMGRPIIFIPGIQDMNDIQTVAGITVLGRVARTAAERDALLEVPTCRSLVMTAARETVQASCLDVGRPDAFDERRIYYTTDEQFGYVAAVTGVMVRERPATCFYMGAFFAESLILAETANMCGAIQIAGTAQPAQLPFFVAACDYTLIGEEFFAASAYLSGEPAQLGSLKGQDMGKLFGLVLIAAGAVAATLYEFDKGGFTYRVLDFLTETLLETGS